MTQDATTNSSNITPTNESLQSGESIAVAAPTTLATNKKDELLPHTTQQKNIYSIGRHIVLICCILFGLCLIIFLVHQNGKSIYENGL